MLKTKRKYAIVITQLFPTVPLSAEKTKTTIVFIPFRVPNMSKGLKGRLLMWVHSGLEVRTVIV